MTMLEIEIPRTFASLNDLLRMHWRHRHRNCQMWQEEIWMALVGKERPMRPFQKARVSIHRRGRGRGLDPDNLVGAVKPILDALRYARILVDDTPEHVELVVTQSKGLPSTRINIRSLT